jgi:hypothetical protein
MKLCFQKFLTLNFLFFSFGFSPLVLSGRGEESGQLLALVENGLPLDIRVLRTKQKSEEDTNKSIVRLNDSISKTINRSIA